MERHLTDAVDCDLGDVVDLSATGLRISCKGRPPLAPGAIGRLRLRGADGAVTITARAAWIRRCGFRRYEIGLQFLDVKPRLAAAIEALARYGFLSGGDIHDDRASRRAPGDPGDPGTSGTAAGAGRATGHRGERGKATLRACFSLPDYYALLGVNPEANAAEIQAAYRRLARQFHPDVNREPGAHERFVEIARAYEVLRDPEQRRRFDLRGAA